MRAITVRPYYLILSGILVLVALAMALIAWLRSAPYPVDFYGNTAPPQGGGWKWFAGAAFTIGLAIACGVLGTRKSPSAAADAVTHTEEPRDPLALRAMFGLVACLPAMVLAWTLLQWNSVLVALFGVGVSAIFALGGGIAHGVLRLAVLFGAFTLGARVDGGGNQLVVTIVALLLGFGVLEVAWSRLAGRD
jgi:hypothetical protein